ncbi:MAG: MtrB/PioB family outer membrane beta-barrel protein [Acidobacteria bacterium]|nr:MtrB/PioB family outer membrane beta-barrel protein [Acidobacteriota bacterium]
MRTKLLWWFLGVAVLSVFFLPEKAFAQDVERKKGHVEFGVRQLYGERASAKFTEYRHIPQGFFVQHFGLDLDDLLNNSFFANFQGRETLERDQNYLLDLGKYRKYQFQFRWDQTPHLFTTTGKSFFLEPSAGVFTVPGPLRSLLVPPPPPAPAQTTQQRQVLLQDALQDARLLDLSLRRDIGSGTFTYVPAPHWDLGLQYSREKQVGHRPFGTTMYFGFVNELPEPINYMTHKVKLGTEYGSETGGFQLDYSSSIFNNRVSTLVWDNPFRNVDAVDNPSRGRLDLYPDNSAHKFSFAGAANMPYSTRLMASIAPGWMRQNDAFLPFTTNTAIPVCPSNYAFPALPRPAASLCVPSGLPASDLDGRKQTLAMNFKLASRGISALPLSVSYRSYDYNNDSRSLIFNDYVASDMHVSGMARRNLPFGYSRKNLGLDAGLEFLKNSSVAFLYQWERLDREHRDLEQADEHTVGFKFDFNALDWLLLKASYRHSDRDAEHYEADEESFPIGEGPFGMGQIHELRKLDEAARKRHRAEVVLQMDPSETYGFAASYGTTQDDFAESLYGLQKDINYNYTFEFTFNPHRAVSLFAEYTREKYKYRQRSRQRTPASATAAANDSANNDWESVRRDLVDNWAVGWDGNVAEKAIFSAFYSLSAAKNRVSTLALGNPRLPGFLVTTAQDYPDTSNRWHQVVASFKFPLGRGFSPKLEYRYERYDRIDFALESVVQYNILDVSLVNSIFLGVGADIPGYRAHNIAVSLEYDF